jgi:hypothetical protein
MLALGCISFRDAKGSSNRVGRPLRLCGIRRKAIAKRGHSPAMRVSRGDKVKKENVVVVVDRR